MQNVLFILTILSAAFQFLAFNSEFKNESYQLRTIVIDAGHGGWDNATRGSLFTEAEIALKTALRLGQAIKEKFKDLRVVYTRTTDVYVPLYERIALANREKADIFISIHCNSMPKNSKNRTLTQGAETFVSGSGRLSEQDVAIRENLSILSEKNYEVNYGGYNPTDPTTAILLSLTKNKYREQSIKLASSLQEEYFKVGRKDRGVKEQSLAVLAKAGMPAILTEIGFISNPAEEKFLYSSAGQAKIVESLLGAISRYKKSVEVQ